MLLKLLVPRKCLINKIFFGSGSVNCNSYIQSSFKDAKSQVRAKGINVQFIYCYYFYSTFISHSIRHAAIK